MANVFASYPVAGGGGGSSLTFADSIVNNAGTVTLVNDSAAPGNSKYYGTDGSGTLGYFSLPSSGVLTVGPFGSSPNAAGASISGTVLTLQPADATHPGGISITTQSFGGAKTFTAATTITGSADAVQLQITGNATQTSKILDVQTSTATDLFNVDNAGSGYFAGFLRVGTTVALQNALAEQATVLSTLTSDQNTTSPALFVRNVMNTASASAMTALFGTNTQVQRQNAAASGTSEGLGLAALNSQVTINYQSGQTYTNTNTSSGVSSYRIQNIGNTNSSTLAITNYAGIKYADDTANTGTYKVALRFGSWSGATNNTLISDTDVAGNYFIYAANTNASIFTGPVRTGTAVALQNALAEQATVLNTLTSDQNTTSPALFVRNLMNTASASSMTILFGTNTTVQRQNAAASGTSEALGLAALNSQATINYQSGQTYTNTNTTNGVSSYRIQNIGNTNSSTLAITNYAGIKYVDDTANTGTYKVALRFGSWSGATNNALIADADPTGSYFIYSTNTNPSVLSGTLTVASTIINPGPLRIGTTTAITTLEETSSLYTSNAPNAALTYSIYGRNLLSTASANSNGMIGIKGDVYRQNLAASGTTDTSQLNAIRTQLHIDYQAAQTYTNTSSGNNCLFIGVLDNVNASTLAITNYFGIQYQNDTVATGTYKVALRFGSWSGATNNAFISDNVGFTGSYFINSTSTNASLLSGTLTVANLIDSGLPASSTVFTDGSKQLTSTGTVAVANGGTGIASYTVGDLLYASGTTTLSKLAIGSTGKFLSVSGGLPAWTAITGTANRFYVIDGSGNGGTNASAQFTGQGTSSPNFIFGDTTTSTVTETDFKTSAGGRVINRMQGGASNYYDLDYNGSDEHLSFTYTGTTYIKITPVTAGSVSFTSFIIGSTAGTPIPVTFNTSIGLTSPQTTLTGAAGTAVCSQPFQGSSFKEVVVYLSGYTDTNTQIYTFPTAFAHTPELSGTALGVAGATVSTTTIRFTTVVTTGFVFARGF